MALSMPTVLLIAMTVFQSGSVRNAQPALVGGQDASLKPECQNHHLEVVADEQGCQSGIS